MAYANGCASAVISTSVFAVKEHKRKLASVFFIDLIKSCFKKASQPPIMELEEAVLIDGTDDTCSLLQDLIVRLLSGCLNNQDITTSNYQMYLRRLFRHKCQEERRSNPFDNDIDFHFLPSRTKIEILYDLCDYRLASADAFEALKNLEPTSLRVKPLGWDRHKSTYWYFYGTRLYKETLVDQTATSPSKSLSVPKSSPRRLQKLLGFPLPRHLGTRWAVICLTEADWTTLCNSFELSRRNAEKSLYCTLKEDFLPELPHLFAEKKKEQRRRALTMASKRLGSRSKHSTNEDDLDKKPDREGKRPRFDDDEWAALRNNADRATRALLREISRDHSADSQSLDSSSRSLSRAGSTDSLHTKKKDKRDKHKKQQSADKSHLKPPSKVPSPPKPSFKSKDKEQDKERKKDVRDSPKTVRDSPKKSKAEGKAVFKGRKTNNSLASAVDLGLLEESAGKSKSPKTSGNGPTGSRLRAVLSKILCLLRNHPDAWPFLDPVDEDYAPDYYRMVSQPMDLERMEAKLHTDQYSTAHAFRDDFQLIVKNCRIYNGPESEYCGMVESLKKEFSKLVMKYLDIKEEEEEEDEEKEVVKRKVVSKISKLEDEQESVEEECVKELKRASKNDSSAKLVKKSKKKKKSHGDSDRKSKDRGKKHKVEEEDPDDAWNTPEECSENERDLKALATKRKAKLSESQVMSDSEPECQRRKTKAERKLYDKDSSASRAASKVNGAVQAKRKDKLPVKSRAAINALAEATEQTLKDINKWLDDTPKFSEFSPSASPKAAVTAEEFESIASSIESQYRKSLNADKPKIKAKALKHKQKGLLVLAGAGKRAKLLAEAEKRDKVSDEEEREENVKKKKKEDPSKPKEKEVLKTGKDAVVNPRKDINRTIERMQLAGKNKLGTLAKVSRPDESKLNSLIAKAKESRDLKNPPTTETALTPKLSLGTVLTSDIGMSTKTEVESVNVPPEETTSPVDKPSPELDKTSPDKSTSASPEVEVDPTQPGPVEIKQGKATPNLSAWFKAFGAPKTGMAPKKKVEGGDVAPKPSISPPKLLPPPPNPPKLEKSEKLDLPWYSKLDKKDSPAKTLWGNLEKDDFPNFLASTSNAGPATTSPNPPTTLPFPKRSKDDEEGARRLLSLHQGHMEPSPADSGSGGSPANSPAFGGSEGERSPMTPSWNGRNGGANGAGPNPSPASSDLVIRSPATPDMGSPYAPPIRVGFYQDMSQKTAPSPSPVNSIKSPAPSPHPTPVATTKASPVPRNHPSPLNEPQKTFATTMEPTPPPQYRPSSAASQVLQNQLTVTPNALPAYNPPVLNKAPTPVEMPTVDERPSQPGYPLKKRVTEDPSVQPLTNLAPMGNTPYGYLSNPPNTFPPISQVQGVPSVNTLPGNLASLSQIVARIPTTDSSTLAHIGNAVAAPMNRSAPAPSLAPVNTTSAPSSYPSHAFLNPPNQNHPNPSSNAYLTSQQGYQRLQTPYAPNFSHYGQVPQNGVRPEAPRGAIKTSAQPVVQQSQARLQNESINYSSYQQPMGSQASQWQAYDTRSAVPTQAEDIWNRHPPTYSNASIPGYPSPPVTLPPTTYAVPSSTVAASRVAVSSSQPITSSTATASRVSTNQNHTISTLASNPHLWPPSSTTRSTTSAAPSQLTFSSMGYEHMMPGSLLFSGLDPLTANHSMFRSGLGPPPGSGASRSSPWAPPSLSFDTSTASTSSTVTSLSLPTSVATGSTTMRNASSRTSSSSSGSAMAPRESVPSNAPNPFDPAQRTASLSGSAFNYSAAMQSGSSDTLAATLYGRHPQRTLQQTQASTSPGLARPQGMHPQPGSGNPLLTGLGGSPSSLTRPVPHSYLGGPGTRPGTASNNSQTLPPPPAHQGYPQQGPHPSHGSLLSHPGFGTPSLPMTSPFGDFLGSGQSLPPGAHPLADPSSPFYQQLLQRQQHEELLLRTTPHPHSHPMLQPGLLGSASYPPGFTPGLGLQQSFQGWL